MAPLTRNDLMDELTNLGIATETVDHPPLFTVEDSKTLRGTIHGGHTKNLFVKDKKGALFLLVVDEDSSIDMKSLHKTLGCGRLSFGKPDLLMEVLGVIPGAVTAFAIANDRDKRVQIVFDEQLMQNDKINCHPLTNDATTTIKRDDLIAFVRATGHKPSIMRLGGETGNVE
ncbi:MAG: prolyl-tRNA synthetase associated domain-containing protein [Pseudomonadota bacterium]